MNEVASLDEQRIVELLSGLNRVSAPGDFNFRVKARIAGGAPSARRSWTPAALKMAFPVLLLTVISGFFLMMDTAPVPSDHVAKADDVQLVPSAVSQEPALSARQPTVTVPAADLPAVIKVEPKQMVASVKSDRTRSAKPAVLKEESETASASGSIDMSSNVSRGIVLPLNGNANRTFPAPKTANRPSRLSPTGVFSLMGIKGSYSGPEFKVLGVTASSAADQSGVKPGDVIEAINGQTLSGGLTFPHDFSGGSLRLRRNGQVIVVNIGQ